MHRYPSVRSGWGPDIRTEFLHELSGCSADAGIAVRGACLGFCTARWCASQHGSRFSKFSRDDYLIAIPPALRPEISERRQLRYLGGEQLQMRLRPPWRQSRRQCPRIEVGDRDVVVEIPDHPDRGFGIDDLQKAALPQLFAIAQMLGKGLKFSRRQPCRVIVGLIDHVVGGLGEDFRGIVELGSDTKSR